MKIFSLNVNRFGKTVNFKYNKSTPSEIVEWRNDCNLRKETAKDIAKYVTDSRNGIDVALFQEVDYKECFDEFVSYAPSLFVQRGTCSEPVHKEVFALCCRPGGKAE